MTLTYATVGWLLAIASVGALCFFAGVAYEIWWVATGPRGC